MKFPVWIAQYDVEECTGDYFNLICWQYTSKGSVDGISGNVDMNIGYNGLLQSNTNGWVKEGEAWYYYENGQPVKSAWRLIDGKWYALGADGKMLDGIQTIAGKQYYFYEESEGGRFHGEMAQTNEKGELV